MVLFPVVCMSPSQFCTWKLTNRELYNNVSGQFNGVVKSDLYYSYRWGTTLYTEENLMAKMDVIEA